MDCFGAYFTHAQTIPNLMQPVFKVLRNGLLRYILYTCPNLMQPVFKVLQNGLLRYILYTCPNLMFKVLRNGLLWNGSKKPSAANSGVTLFLGILQMSFHHGFASCRTGKATSFFLSLRLIAAELMMASCLRMAYGGMGSLIFPPVHLMASGKSWQRERRMDGVWIEG